MIKYKGKANKPLSSGVMPKQQEGWIMTRTMTVAAVQINCVLGKVNNNLARARHLTEKAVEKGGQLVLLPELMPSGLTLTEKIWDFAETINGDSVNWLLRTAKDLHIYLGFTFLEADGEDFFNSFVLSSPEGELIGRVRKNPPASLEAYFYKAGSDSHVIETELGRIGVGICYENFLYDKICFLHRENVDLVLMPTAAPRPYPALRRDVKRLEKALVATRAIFPKTLGVPVVMANRVGPFRTELPAFFPFYKSSFLGLSSIVDSDGTLKAELGEEEGIIVADVSLGHDTGKKYEPRRYGKMWAVPVPWYFFALPMTQKMGEKSYTANSRRKTHALAVSQSSKIEESA